MHPIVHAVDLLKSLLKSKISFFVKRTDARIHFILNDFYFLYTECFSDLFFVPHLLLLAQPLLHYCYLIYCWWKFSNSSAEKKKSVDSIQRLWIMFNKQADMISLCTPDYHSAAGTMATRRYNCTKYNKIASTI